VRVAIVGGTGMIGTLLAQALRARGDEVRIVTRRLPKTGEEVRWDPVRGEIEVGKLEGIDGVVNLAGAPIADRPWTRARRKVLWESRIDATKMLIDSLRAAKIRPRVWVGAGGLGRFGSRGEDELDDDASPGSGFLADLSVAWEQAQLDAEKIGSRAATFRMAIVLDPHGGALPLMVKPFKIGIGGWLGDGRQFTSWITGRDAVNGFVHLLDNDASAGGYNGTVPVPTRNYEWCRALGRAVHKPVLTHAPKWAVRGALGELADDLFLASVRAVPRKLTSEGFKFLDPDPEAAFASLVAQLPQ
jgi:uncharacterized protein (TIGR01777 family)